MTEDCECESNVQLQTSNSWKAEEMIKIMNDSIQNL